MANQTLILNVSDETKLDDVRQELCELESAEELCSWEYPKVCVNLQTDVR